MTDPQRENPLPERPMTDQERDEMADQMEEFEGPERREIRGDDSEPADDPGVAHS